MQTKKCKKNPLCKVKYLSFTCVAEVLLAFAYKQKSSSKMFMKPIILQIHPESVPVSFFIISEGSDFF